jgi:hypothetical protein
MLYLKWISSHISGFWWHIALRNPFSQKQINDNNWWLSISVNTRIDQPMGWSTHGLINPCIHRNWKSLTVLLYDIKSESHHISQASDDILLSEIHSHKNKSMIVYIYFKSKIVIIVQQTKLLDLTHGLINPWVDQSLYSPKLKVINCFIIWH